MSDEVPDYTTGERPPGWELREKPVYDPRTVDDFDFRFRFGRDRHCDDDVGQSPHQHCGKCGLVLERHVGGAQCPSDDASTDAPSQN